MTSNTCGKIGFPGVLAKKDWKSFVHYFRVPSRRNVVWQNGASTAYVIVHVVAAFAEIQSATRDVGSKSSTLVLLKYSSKRGSACVTASRQSVSVEIGHVRESVFGIIP
jgi:hypothetical protein